MISLRLPSSHRYAFLCDRWLAVDMDDGSLERMLPSASREDLTNFSHLFSTSTRKDMSDDHLWFSLMSRPTRSRFTRVQRLTCCLALLFSTMIGNAMWYKTTDLVEDAQNVEIGPFNFSPQQLYISIVSSLVSVPISILIVALFRKSAPKPVRPNQGSSGGCFSKPKAKPVTPAVQYSDTPHEWKEFDELLNGAGTPTPRSPTPAVRRDPALLSQPVRRKKKFLLPYWCVYIAWFLSFVVVALSGFFTLLYSFEWGKKKSSQWLTAFILSFIESVILIQPVKVRRGLPPQLDSSSSCI